MSSFDELKRKWQDWIERNDDLGGVLEDIKKHLKKPGDSYRIYLSISHSYRRYVNYGMRGGNRNGTDYADTVIRLIDFIDHLTEDNVEIPVEQIPTKPSNPPELSKVNTNETHNSSGNQNGTNSSIPPYLKKLLTRSNGISLVILVFLAIGGVFLYDYLYISEKEAYAALEPLTIPKAEGFLDKHGDSEHFEEVKQKLEDLNGEIEKRLYDAERVMGIGPKYDTLAMRELDTVLMRDPNNQEAIKLKSTLSIKQQ